MAYELVEEQLKEATSGKGFAPSVSEGASPWYMNYDAGYGDTFRTLKQEMDQVYAQYRDQLAYLPRKKEELIRESRSKLLTMLLLLFSPLIFAGITRVFMGLGEASGLFGLFYIIAVILQSIGSIVCIFFLLPGAVRNYFNCRYRQHKLGKEAHGSLDRYTEINFADEEHFLTEKIAEYDRFYARAAREDLEHIRNTADRSDENVIDLSDQLSPEQESILSYMRSLSQMQDVQAKIGAERKEAGPASVLVGLGILVAVLAFMIIL